MHLKTRAPYPGWRGGLFRWFGLIALVLLFAQQSGAQNRLLTIGNKDSYVLSRPFTYLEESRAALTQDEVLRPGLQARFLLFFFRLKMPTLDRWMLALTGLWVGAVFAALFFALRSRVVARNSAGIADRGEGCICRGRQHPAPPPRRGIFCACLGRIAVRCRHPGRAQKCSRRARKRSLRTVLALAYTPKSVR